MSIPNTARLQFGLAIAVAAAGGLLALYTLASLPEELHRFERKTTDLATLRRLAANNRGSQQALAPLEALTTQQPPPLSELLAKTLPGLLPTIHQRESQAAANGWQVRRTEVKFDAAPAALGSFLAAAEAARPPWRLVGFDLFSGVPGPETVRATLLLEALEKK